VITDVVCTVHCNYFQVVVVVVSAAAVAAVADDDDCCCHGLSPGLQLVPWLCEQVL
jgi:hypothetical protein